MSQRKAQSRLGPSVDYGEYALMGASRQQTQPVMSVVGLKTLLFGRPDGTLTKGLLSPAASSTSSDIMNVAEPDLESQTLVEKTEELEKPRNSMGSARIVSDATIGLSDGLTVPFALTAGLSALGSTRMVIFGGLAELIAGAISMGLGGYLGAKSELASYNETRKETARLIKSSPGAVDLAIRETFEPFDLPPYTLQELSDHLASSSKLLDFLMQFQHGAAEPASNRAVTSAVTIALGYFLGGLLPLVPYFCVGDLYTALYLSIGVMAAALFAFGYVKTCIVSGWTGRAHVLQGVSGGVQMMIVGGAAAAAAMGLVKLFDQLAK